MDVITLPCLIRVSVSGNLDNAFKALTTYLPEEQSLINMEYYDEEHLDFSI